MTTTRGRAKKPTRKKKARARARTAKPRPRSSKAKQKAKGERKRKALRAIDVAVQCPECEKASRILATAHESADALLKAFDLARDERGKWIGMTTDEEQDLLRAMLVMAAAGLDAMTKQLVEDVLPRLVGIDSTAMNTFEKFAMRRLALSGEEPDRIGGAKLLARVLSRSSPQQQLIQEYVDDLTEGSLQSYEALYEMAAALGLAPSKVGIARDDLGPIFAVRNQVIHELDINLDVERRIRNVRRCPTMMKYANTLLSVAQNMLQGVDSKLHSGQGGAGGKE